MAMHGGTSAKSTCLWSNSSHIACLNRGPIPKVPSLMCDRTVFHMFFKCIARASACSFSLLAESKRSSLVPVAKYYHDARGVRRSTGKQCLLRASQSCSQTVGCVHPVSEDDTYAYAYCICTPDMPHLRTYPVGFGNALADIVRTMHEGVRGLRIGNVSQLHFVVDTNACYNYTTICGSMEST